MAEKIDQTSNDESTIIQNIRSDARDELNSIRKQQRNNFLNKNRIALAATCNNDKLTIEFVTKTVQSLKKKSLVITEYNKLQNALIQVKKKIVLLHLIAISY